MTAPYRTPGERDVILCDRCDQPARGMSSRGEIDSRRFGCSEAHWRDYSDPPPGRSRLPHISFDGVMRLLREQCASNKSRRKKKS